MNVDLSLKEMKLLDTHFKLVLIELLKIYGVRSCARCRHFGIHRVYEDDILIDLIFICCGGSPGVRLVRLNRVKCGCVWFIDDFIDG